MSEPIIKVKNVTKVYRLYKSNKERMKSVLFRKGKYKKKKAVNNVSLEIYKGETVAFIGNNGAGKSTLMKMITGVTFPTKGEIEVNGNINAILELRAGFDPEFTGRQNLYLRGRLLGWSDEQIKEHENEIIEFAELGEYIDQPVRTYSSGMAARLGFAINMTMKPDILIIDEAMGVGDRGFRIKCINRLKSIVSDENVTLLFVSGSMLLNKQLCTRGIVIDSGKVAFDGPVKEAGKFYDTHFVRREPIEKSLEEELEERSLELDTDDDDDDESEEM